MSKKFISFLIHLLGLSPIVGFLCFAVFNISYTYLMIALFYAATIFQFVDPLTYNSKYSFPKYLVFFVLFVIFSIISDLYIVGHQFSLKYIYSNEYIGSFLVLLVVENYRNYNKKILENLNFIFVLTIIAALVVILIQESVNETFFVFMERAESDLMHYDVTENRLPSIFSWTSVLDIGFVFIPLLSLVIGRQFNKKGKFIVFYFIVGAIVVFLSRNRWIMVNYLVLFFMYAAYYKASLKNLIKYTTAIIIIIYLAMTILTFVNVTVMRIIDNRILEKSQGGLGEGSAGSRIIAIQVFAELFPKHMLIGKGMFHAFGGESKDTELISALQGRSSQIHVGYLSLLYYYGLVGGFLYLSFLITLTRKLYRDAKTTSYWGPYFGFLGLVLANFTLVSLSFFNAGLILCLFFNKVYLNNHEKFLQNQPVRT
jgi:hypothetical protein